MKQLIFLFTYAIFCISTLYAQNSENHVSVSGRVTDFDGIPIDSAIVRILHDNFSEAYYTYSDKNGYYTIPMVEKGKYKAMYVLRPKEYPRENAVAREDMRLEFWAWNLVIDRDITINPHYHRLELYGTTAFRIPNSKGGFMIYTRPMSLEKVTSYSDEIMVNKKESEKVMDVSVAPEYFVPEVFADDEPLKVNSVHPIEEWIGVEGQSITGYIIQVDAPKQKTGKPYIIFRVTATNKEFGEKGENLYFYEISDYK